MPMCVMNTTKSYWMRYLKFTSVTMLWNTDVSFSWMYHGWFMNKERLLWWVCVCRLWLGFNAGKLPHSKFSMLRASSFLSWSIFKSVRLDAVMSGVYSMFPEKPLWSRLWTTLFILRPDDPVIDLKTISNLANTMLWTRFSTAVKALSTSLWFHRQNLFQLPQWLTLLPPTVDLRKL